MMCSILEAKSRVVYWLQRRPTYRSIMLFDSVSELDHGDIPYGGTPISVDNLLVMFVDDEIKQSNSGVDKETTLFYRKVIGVDQEFMGWISTFLDTTFFMEYLDDEHP